MYPFNACRSDAKEGIKRVSGRLDVLVRTEDEGVNPTNPSMTNAIWWDGNRKTGMVAITAKAQETILL